MTLDDYKHGGFWPGLLAAGLTFVGAWGYCAATSGFLLGFGLGWLPAAIAAFLVFHVVRWLWLPLALLVALAAILLVYAWAVNA
jgi:hypothetical protein